MTAGVAMPHIGVMAMVPDYFDEPWQSRHQVLTRLGRYFHIVWIEPTPEWRQLLFQPRRQGSRDPAVARIPGFEICEPAAWLPVVHKPAWLGNALARARLKRARRMLESHGCTKIVVSLWRPKFDWVLSMVPHDIAVYHIDDEYTFSNVELNPDAREQRLIETVDAVTVTSRELLRRKGSANPRTFFIPNGVAFDNYASPAPEPRDLAGIPHPRIGYTGYIKSQLDWDLLRVVIDAHPQWHFVFVGRQRLHDGIGPLIEALATRPNVHFLPEKKQHDLAAYPQHFDVCVMPYQANDYTKYIYPLKLHEFLASGRPVVGTQLPSFEQFGNVVAQATTPAEWSAAIASALEPAARADDLRAARQAIAREHDWTSIAHQMARAIVSPLGSQTLDVFDQVLGTNSD